MLKLSIINAVFLLLPFILGYIHQKGVKNERSAIIFYRYFMFFNMLLSGLFVAGRMIFDGRNAAAISGWSYNPLFILYGLAVLSMVLMGFFTLFSRTCLMLAPAILWTAFLITSAIAHVIEISMGRIADVGIIMVHISFDIVIVIVMLRFLFSLRGNFEGANDKHHAINSTH